MPPPDEAPKLNPWPFIAGDVLLIAAATFIAVNARAPLAPPALLALSACLGLGAILACIPFVLNHTRRQQIALDERQNEIAALARSTATSAEQLSIAAAGLHGIAESATKALKHADQLPSRLQEKINEFKTQLNEVAVTENEALADEVNALRASDTERLESALSAIRKSAADLASVETAARKQIETLEQTLRRSADSLEHASASGTSRLLAQQTASEKSLAQAQTAAVHAIEQALARAAADLETRLKSIAPPPATASDSPAAPALSPASSPPFSAPTTAVSAPPQPPPAASTTTPIAAVTITDADSTPPILRPRTPRKPAGRDDGPSLGLEFTAHSSSPVDDYTQIAPDESLSPTAVSADGCTRLIVTAYIGIGNKLYLRGDGPGLNRDRGVPLQFVSIGKWRWETAEASGPVALRIYKNDEQECASVGEIVIEPGRQQEITATF